MKSADLQHSPNILLVHGAIADGSTWRHVIQNLQRNNFTVIASQLPLTSFADDVTAVKRDLGPLRGATVVVGHSYGGAVITQAAAGASNVVSLVYIAAIVPDTGDSVRSLLTHYPRPPSAQYFVPVDPNETPPFFIFQRDQFPQFVCQDVKPSTARAQAAAQGPTSETCYTTPLEGVPAWRQFPTWYQICTDDRSLDPTVQKAMANRITSPDRIVSIKASHYPLLSHPDKVTRFIEQAARHSATPHSSEGTSLTETDEALFG
jgi:pimeloyl-ACP methyl ester carboxylesterase